MTLWSRSHEKVAQYPLHHVTYAATKFEVARSHGLGGDTFTRNVTGTQTHVRTDGRRADFGTKLILKKKRYNKKDPQKKHRLDQQACN